MDPQTSNPLERFRAWWATQTTSSLLPIFLAKDAPLDLRIVGRVVLRAVLVGVAAGVVGAAFFGALEYLQRFFLEDLAGYVPLRASGENFLPEVEDRHFRPWLLFLLPALGGLACGFLTRLAPETRGGGGDAMIEAFHKKGGHIRKRVIWLKALASACTLGTGGAGGREGPTMLIGGAIGSTVGRVLGVSARERRLLLVAGVAAGIAAVFRTPLGAAILAVEVLYRDGFESDALIPSVLASVVSYSIVASIFGESTLFGHAPRFPFHPWQLVLYAGMALCVALLAAAFVAALGRSRRAFRRLPLPDWARPALGGLLLGAFCVPIILWVDAQLGSQGQGLGLLGGGYGAVQLAISGAAWLPGGWAAAELLLLLAFAKLIAASITIGSEGSAGDFAPSLAIGGLFGGAFGRAMQLVFDDPSIDPGAFALVGMGVFYGGIAHVPLAALVLVCELAGNYDLLVPLMLAQGIAFVALRNRALYGAQISSPDESPAHREAAVEQALAARVSDLMIREIAVIQAEDQGDSALLAAERAPRQPLYPVVTAAGALAGALYSTDLARLAQTTDQRAAETAHPVGSACVDEPLRVAVERLLAAREPALVVRDAAGTVIGLLTAERVAQLFLTHPGPEPAP